MILLLLAVSGVLTGSESLDGIWQSRGYGYVFEIKGPVLREYEVTATTCVQPYESERVATKRAGITAAFRNSKEGFFYFRESGTVDRQVLSEGITDIELNRIASLPTVCEHVTESTPAGNLKFFQGRLKSNIFHLVFGIWIGKKQ